jgi:hypothetical protein
VAYAEFAISDGSSLLIDQRSEDIGFTDVAARGSGGRIQASASLDEAVRQAVDTVANSFLDAVKRLATQPNELSVEFSMRISAEAGAIVSQDPANSHFRVTFRWYSNEDHRG